MKKINIKKFLLLFTLLSCVFCMTACADTISSDDAKTSTKNMQVNAYSDNIKSWVNDMILYLDSTSDEDIKADAEAGYTISMVNGKSYLINLQGIDDKTVEFYNSWIKTKEDLGALVSIDELEIQISDENGTLCTVAVSATYEDRKCSFELVIDDEYNLSSGAINPEYTVAEKGEKAILNTVLGMGTVFIVLVFISFIISLLKYVNKIGEKKEEPKAEEIPAAVPVEEEAEEVDDYELVAVITAAIAASEGTSADGLVVRSIRKVDRKNNWK